MPESLFRPKELNIKDMTIESPNAMRSPFDIENEITESDWANLIKEVSTPYTREEGYYEDIYMFSMLKLLSPRIFEELYTSIDLEERMDAVFGMLKENFLEKLHRMNGTGDPSGFLRVAFIDAILVPDIAERPSTKINPIEWQMIKSYFEKLLHDPPPDVINSSPTQLVSFKLLSPEQYEQTPFMDNFMVIIKTKIETAYENKQWRDFAELVACAKILYPEHSLDFKIDEASWAGMRALLTRGSDNYSWIDFLGQATWMKLASAKSISVTPQGLVVTESQLSNLAPPTTELPEQRKF